MLGMVHGFISSFFFFLVGAVPVAAIWKNQITNEIFILIRWTAKIKSRHFFQISLLLSRTGHSFFICSFSEKSIHLVSVKRKLLLFFAALHWFECICHSPLQTFGWFVWRVFFKLFFIQFGLVLSPFSCTFSFSNDYGIDCTSGKSEKSSPINGIVCI